MFPKEELMSTSIQNNLQLAMLTAGIATAVNLVVGRIANRTPIQCLGGLSMGQAATFGGVAGASLVAAQLPEGFGKPETVWKILTFIPATFLLAKGLNSSRFGKYQLGSSVKTLVAFSSLNIATVGTLWALTYELSEQARLAALFAPAEFAKQLLALADVKDEHSKPILSSGLMSAIKKVLPEGAKSAHTVSFDDIASTIANTEMELKNLAGQTSEDVRVFLLCTEAQRLVDEMKVSSIPAAVCSLMLAVFSGKAQDGQVTALKHVLDTYHFMESVSPKKDDIEALQKVLKIPEGRIFGTEEEKRRVLAINTSSGMLRIDDQDLALIKKFQRLISVTYINDKRDDMNVALRTFLIKLQLKKIDDQQTTPHPIQSKLVEDVFGEDGSMDKAPALETALAEWLQNVDKNNSPSRNQSSLRSFGWFRR